MLVGFRDQAINCLWPNILAELTDSRFNRSIVNRRLMYHGTKQDTILLTNQATLLRGVRIEDSQSGLTSWLFSDQATMSIRQTAIDSSFLANRN